MTPENAIPDNSPKEEPPLGSAKTRRVLTDISPRSWEHPADRAALHTRCRWFQARHTHYRQRQERNAGRGTDGQLAAFLFFDVGTFDVHCRDTNKGRAKKPML